MLSGGRQSRGEGRQGAAAARLCPPPPAPAHWREAISAATLPLNSLLHAVGAGQGQRCREPADQAERPAAAQPPANRRRAPTARRRPAWRWPPPRSSASPPRLPPWRWPPAVRVGGAARSERRRPAGGCWPGVPRRLHLAACILPTTVPPQPTPPHLAGLQLRLVVRGLAQQARQLALGLHQRGARQLAALHRRVVRRLRALLPRLDLLDLLLCR